MASWNTPITRVQVSHSKGVKLIKRSDKGCRWIPLHAKRAKCCVSKSILGKIMILGILIEKFQYWSVYQMGRGNAGLAICKICSFFNGRPCRLSALEDGLSIGEHWQPNGNFLWRYVFQIRQVFTYRLAYHVF